MSRRTRRDSVIERSEQVTISFTKPSGGLVSKRFIQWRSGGTWFPIVLIPESGETTLDRLPAPEITIEGESGWLMRSSLALERGESVRRNIVVPEPGKIEGKLPDDGLEYPMSPNRVSAVPVGSDRWPSLRQSYVKRDGTFTLEHLAPGAYHVVVTSPRQEGLSRLWWTTKVDVKSGQSSFVEGVAPTSGFGVLEIRARDGDWRLRQSQARLHMKSGEPICPRVMMDEHGRLRSAVRAGEYLLTVESPGYKTVERTIVISADQRTSIDLDLEARNTGDIETVFTTESTIAVTPWVGGSRDAGARPLTSLRALLQMCSTRIPGGIDFTAIPEETLRKRAYWSWNQVRESILLETAIDLHELTWSHEEGRLTVKPSAD